MKGISENQRASFFKFEKSLSFLKNKAGILGNVGGYLRIHLQIPEYI
jgi:hypothetical protein